LHIFFCHFEKGKIEVASISMSKRTPLPYIYEDENNIVAIIISTTLLLPRVELSNSPRSNFSTNNDDNNDTSNNYFLQIDCIA